MPNTMRLERLKAAILPLLLISTLFMAGGCRDKAGKGGAEKPAFDYRQIELANGLDVITLEDFSCPIVSVQIWYHVGSKDEKADRQGFAHMFEHMMFRGTDRLGPTDHFGYIRRVGGSTNGYTGFDRTVYLETLPADQLALALWLEAERMAFLKIDQQAFETERKVVEEERRMGLNSPYGTLVEDILDKVYSVHPYRWPPIGKISNLRAASVPELRDFWQRYYVPSNAAIIIVGAVKHEEAQKQVEKYFGWINNSPQPPRVTAVEPEPNGSRSITLKPANAPAPGIGVVYRTVPLNHKDAIVCDLMAEILGSGNSSRLYRKLVADTQLAAAAEAVSWTLEQDGLFGAGAVMPPFNSDANEVLKVIEQEIERLRTEPVTDAELTKAKNQMQRSLVTTNLRIESKAQMLGSAVIEYGDVSQVNRQLDDIRRVTAADITRAAKEYLSPERVLKVNVERNLLGAVSSAAGSANNQEENAPITGEVETNPPKPGRPGQVRGEDFPSDPPTVQSLPAKLTPQYSSDVLDNGLKVIVVPNREVPFVSVQLGLLAGAWTEEKPGTAAMTMQMLTKGSAKHTEGELAEELETFAIGLQGAGQMDTATVNMSCLTEHIDRAMGLLGEVALTPTFSPEEFEKLRGQVLTSLAVASAEPEYIAEREFRKRLYGGHPYARTPAGEVEDVNALAAEDLNQWWKQFARPDTSVLIFAGDIERDRALALAKKTFDGWKVQTPVQQVALPELPEIGGTRIYLVDRPGSVQSQIRVGQHGITRRTDGYFTSRVVSNYFGWSFGSRLNQTIRVEKGLTYGVWGSYTAQRFAGEFAVGTFSRTESTAAAVQAVIEEIIRLRNDSCSEEELGSSKSFLLGTFVKDRETPQQIASDLWLIESEHLGADYLERLLGTVAITERADCEKLVDKTLEPDKLVIVVVGEADKIRDELEKIAPVTVIPAEDSK